MSMQVFRVSLKKDKGAGNDAVAAEQRDFRSRRSHKKSRGGCFACKVKRKKCDEDQPQCTSCTKKGVPCIYPIQRNNRGRQVLRPLEPMNLVPTSLRTPLVLLAEGQWTDHDLNLLGHWRDMNNQSLNGTEMAEVYANQCFELAKEKTYLMHAAIALAACHLQYVEADSKEYRYAEAFHLQLASRGLCNAVASIKGVKDCDAILSASMLINALAFCAADYRDPNIPQWGWLRIQIGLTDLLMQTKPYHPESMWLWLFVATNTFEIKEPPSNDLGDRLSAFCGITDESNEENCIYFEPIRLLHPIITRPPNKDYMLLYTYFIGSITREFIDLCEARDTKALLIMANWLALMTSVKEWWSERRARQECWKICDYLINMLDTKDLALLEFPAKAVGYL